MFDCNCLTDATAIVVSTSTTVNVTTFPTAVAIIVTVVVTTNAAEGLSTNTAAQMYQLQFYA
jgi:hypothetical protein